MKKKSVRTLVLYDHDWGLEQVMIDDVRYGQMAVKQIVKRISISDGK